MSVWRDQKQIGYLGNKWTKKKWSKCREQNSPRIVFMKAGIYQTVCGIGYARKINTSSYTKNTSFN